MADEALTEIHFNGAEDPITVKGNPGEVSSLLNAGPWAQLEDTASNEQVMVRLDAVAYLLAVEPMEPETRRGDFL